MLDTDGFSGFLFYLFIVSPAVGWFLKPGRFTRSKGVIYAVSFLIAIASINIGVKISQQNANFYQILDISRDSMLSDIKRAYRIRSTEIHPDKSTSPTAADEFNRLRLAFDVLSDAEKKRLYDCFGEETSLKTNANTDPVSTLVSILSFYTVWAIMAYLITLGSNISHARSFIYLGGLSIMILELNIRFGMFDLPVNLFPKTTNHEFLLLLQSILPAYMNGCRAIGSFLHFDWDEQNFQLGIEILKSNKELQLMIHQLYVDLSSKRVKTSESPFILQNKDILPKRSKLTKKVSSNNTEEKRNPSVQTAEEIITPSPKLQSPPQWKIPSFILMIAFYGFVHWLFK